MGRAFLCLKLSVCASLMSNWPCKHERCLLGKGEERWRKAERNPSRGLSLAYSASVEWHQGRRAGEPLLRAAMGAACVWVHSVVTRQVHGTSGRRKTCMCVWRGA